MPQLHFSWLEFSVLVPLVGAAGIGVVRNRDVARKLCIAVCLIVLGLTVGEWIDFGTIHNFEAHDHWQVISNLFHRDIFVVDELSAPLLPLVALLYLMTVVGTLRTKVSRFSFGWTLMSEAILLATLSCRDPWILIGLLSAATIPPFVEIRRRGRSTRVYSIHMGFFIALLAAGQFLLDRTSPATTSGIVSGAMVTAACLLRSGIIPLHCWMTDLFEKATFGTALLFVTPITGAYAVMRLVLPIAPDWALQSIAIVSLVTAVYAAAMALVQHEARRYFCYLFLSNSSLVLIGVELVNPIGLTGALCVWLSVTISLAGFGLTFRYVESRTGPVSLDVYHGLYEQMPTLAALFLVTGLAAIGFPGTVGFVGAELLIEGAVLVYPLIGTMVVVAMALNGIAILHAYFRVFTGSRHVASISLRTRIPEKIAVLTLIVLILGGGLFPQSNVSSRYHAAVELMRLRSITTRKKPEITHEAHATASDIAVPPTAGREQAGR